MRILLLFIVLLPLFASGQRDWRSRIDQIVQEADSLSMTSQFTFHLNKFTRQDQPIRETWHYTLNKGRVIIFEVHYFIDSSEFQEVYYVDREQVVCMEQYEILYPKQQEDKIVWGTVGFFEGQDMRQYVTMGKKVDENNPMPGWDAIVLFKSRFKELSATRTILEKNSKGSIFVP